MRYPLTIFAWVDVTRWEDLEPLAIVLQGFHLRGKPNTSCVAENRPSPSSVEIQRPPWGKHISFLFMITNVQTTRSKEHYYHQIPSQGRGGWCRWGHERRWRNCRGCPPTRMRTCRPAFPLPPHPRPHTASNVPFWVLVRPYPKLCK